MSKRGVTDDVIQYARANRAEARDALMVAAMSQTAPPVLDICNPMYDRRARETFRRYVERACERAMRFDSDGEYPLPETTRCHALARSEGFAPGTNWAALVDAIRGAALELDKTIDFTRPT